MYTGLFAGLVGAKNGMKTGTIKLIVANLMPDALPVSMPVQTRFADGYDYPIIGDPTRPRAERLVSRWGVKKRTGRKPPRAVILSLALDTFGFMDTIYWSAYCRHEPHRRS
jgi:hypothetical protein